MILDKVLGNINDLNIDTEHNHSHDDKHKHSHEHGEDCEHSHKPHIHVEKIHLRSDELLKRINRVTSDHGKEYGISVSKETILKDGDILYKDDKNMVVVSVKSDDVLIIKPTSITEMGKIAHNLGNRHLPAQFKEGLMILEYDNLVEDLLKEESIPYARENVTLEKAFRHVEFGHKHV
ncbi:urease accessory protein UreE [uncultured Clostridium sp.]|uniref:urease accessory protein UreE n=1 Tax=uncultured Clostridium sp. TaxID=59620 RepID=UPI00260CE83C|nr:urease accessory protein UreE [uncultured Clostridium sp.]